MASVILTALPWLSHSWEKLPRLSLRPRPGVCVCSVPGSLRGHTAWSPGAWRPAQTQVPETVVRGLTQGLARPAIPGPSEGGADWDLTSAPCPPGARLSSLSCHTHSRPWRQPRPTWEMRKRRLRGVFCAMPVGRGAQILAQSGLALEPEFFFPFLNTLSGQPMMISEHIPYKYMCLI